MRLGSVGVQCSAWRVFAWQPLYAAPGAAAAGASDDSAVTFMLNAQTVEELAFRVDVTSKASGALLARCFVTHQTLSQARGFCFALPAAR